MEAMPQHVAGLRSEPPMSLPKPSGLMPEASAAPSPPLEPPVVRVGCHGLWVTPCSELSVVTRSPRSGRLVRPMGMAPAARARSTSGASMGATASASAWTACVVGVPARSMFSFTVTGTPCSTPSGPPPATARSAASAAASADSSRRRTIGVEPRVHLVDAGEMGFHHLAAGHFLASDQTRQFECTLAPQFVGHGRDAGTPTLLAAARRGRPGVSLPGDGRAQVGQRAAARGRREGRRPFGRCSTPSRRATTSSTGS